MYFWMVFSLVQSSKRIEYPTSLPSLTPISSDTRAATLMAATRRGWVQAIFMLLGRIASLVQILGICVVLPEPVSPTRMRTWNSLMASRNCCRYL